MSRPKQGRWIGYMLYPDCPEHMQYLTYIKDVAKFPYIFIKHFGEKKPLLLVENSFQNFVPISTIPDPVGKDHIHFLCKFPDKITATGAVNYSAGVVHYAEVISSMYSMTTYLLHTDFHSMQLGKRVYTLNDLHYSDASLIAQFFGYKSNEDEHVYLPLIARVGQESETFQDLVKGLTILALNNPDASGALKWACNHPGVIRLMFPYFPNSISDVVKIRKLKSGQDDTF